MSPIARARVGLEIVPESLKRSLIPSFDYMIELPSIRDSLSRHETKLRDIFERYASSKPQYLSAKVDVTMSVREWILLLSRAGIVSCDSTMTVKRAALVALGSSALEDDKESKLNPEDLEVELTYGDFLRSFAHLAYIRVNDDSNNDKDAADKIEKEDDTVTEEENREKENTGLDGEEERNTSVEEKKEDVVDTKDEESNTKCEETKKDVVDTKDEEKDVDENETKAGETTPKHDAMIKTKKKRSKSTRPSSTRSSPLRRAVSRHSLDSTRSKNDGIMVRPNTTNTAVEGLLYDTNEAAQRREEFSKLEKKIAFDMMELIDKSEILLQ